ncbi:MAG: AAA family ATPase [Lentisphaeria bacterium]|nr:AAA family ATPase [Lentisphaeria bacterium]NQZ66660.1 AAA family ATPase [Lentisphaeria bacterium]
MPKLIVQQGHFERGEIEITKGELLIGRDDDCDIKIPDGQVSRHHAKLIFDGKKTTLVDLGSYNGSYLNWNPIDEKSDVKHLDVIQIGKNVFVYNEDENVVEITVDEQDEFKTGEFFTFEFLRNLCSRIELNVAKVFKGKEDVIRNVLVCMLADGHILIEDRPGVGKSILAQALAKSINGSYKRIQFTPDMLPSDIVGISIYQDDTKDFKFIPGPIFGNIILADEINRTTPRTQSGLLECMNDAVVTVDGKSQVLPRPFFVMATQNPSGHQGTYPLPEAQLDRFLMKINVGYPTPEVELEILESQATRHPINDISYVAYALDIVKCCALVRKVHVSDAIKDLIIKIVNATREHPAVVEGVSPRGSLALMRASQALAAYYGRRYVMPADIKEIAIPVMSHRIQMKLRAQSDFVSTDDLVMDIVNSYSDDFKEEDS